MRLRWEHFCWAIIDKASENDGCVDDEVLIGAVRQAFQSAGFDHSDDPAVEKRHRTLALRKAERLLRNPDVRKAIADVYKERGFTLTDAVDKHLEHIREGNYPALKDFLALVLPKAPSRVDLKLSRGTDDTYTPPELPAMQSRVLSTKVDP